MNSYPEANDVGALERLGIPVQTVPPEAILTAGKSKSIRFRISRPSGYAFGDVESYQFDFVIPTLEWYASTLHQRDLAVHKLGEMVDKLEVDLLNAKAQLDNKDYNEAIGMAVEDSESDAEVERLINRVQDLEALLAHTQNELKQAQASGSAAPTGDVFTREEVEGYIASAVADTITERDAFYADHIANLPAPIAAATGYTEDEVHAAIKENVDVAVANAEQAKDAYYAEQIANIPPTAPAGYNEDEVKAAVKENVDAAVAKAEKAKDSYYLAQIATIPTGITQEMLEAAVAEAVVAKEAEIMANLPELAPVDQIAELTNEGDLKLRAENKTLHETVFKLDAYSKELEAYIASLENTPAANEVHVPQINPATGRPLPKLNPDDL